MKWLSLSLPLTTTSLAVLLLWGLGLVGIAAEIALPTDKPDATGNGECLVYVGTYTGSKSKGIYAYRMNQNTGVLTPLGLAAATVHPTFLALHPNGRYLYAANEVGNFNGKPSGSISAFSIDKSTGKLTLLNQKPSGGAGPCHLTVDKTGQSVIAANYGSGSVAVLPILDQGRVGDPACIIQHKGSSVNRQRQEGPHAHGVYLDAANRIALVADLGLDKIMAYKFDPTTSTLTPNDQPWTLCKPGAGPRHLAFHPNGRFLYAINEMGNTVVAYGYDAAEGALTELQTVSALPEGFSGNSTTAEIEVHPTGQFLYGSNRGHDSIVVYAIDATKGTLKLVEHQSTRGKMPRNFGIDPTGNFLLAANQSSDDFYVYRIDRHTGRLTPLGQKIEVGAPVCIKFLPIN